MRNKFYGERSRFCPIFDTSAIVNLSRINATDPIWNRLKRLTPKHGCPLSYVTVLELFHGLSVGGNAKFDDSLKALILASRLSRRKVLLAPFPFFERELFGLRDSGHEKSSANLKRWLGIAIKPDFKSEFASGTINGMNLEKIESLFAHVRKRQGAHVAQFLDGLHPDWRIERHRIVEARSPRQHVRRSNAPTLSIDGSATFPSNYSKQRTFRGPRRQSRLCAMVAMPISLSPSKF